jgi:hypothetical protein
VIPTPSGWKRRLYIYDGSEYGHNGSQALGNRENAQK